MTQHAPATATTTIELIRHGEAEGGRLFRGITDSILSEHGAEQLATVFAVLPQQQLSQVVSSPLQRCYSTALKWAEQLSLPLSKNSALSEIDFGLWEGREVDAVYQEAPSQVENFWADPLSHTPPQGESLINFQRRVLAGWQRLLEQHQGQHIVLLIHGGVMRIILADLLQTPLQQLSHIEVPHACWSRISIYHSDDKPQWPQLVFHNKLAVI